MTASPSTAGRHISRPAINRMLGLHYWDVGQQMAALRRSAPRGKARTAAARLAFRSRYSVRFLYMLARLPLAFSRRRYLELLRELDPGCLLTIAQLQHADDRRDVLAEVRRRPMTARQVEELVSRTRRKGRPSKRRRRKPRSR